MKASLNTSAALNGSLQEIAVPSLVRIPLHEKHKPVVKKKQLVGRGQVVAETSGTYAYDVGFVHATIDGMVMDIAGGSIVIGPVPAPKDGEDAPDIPVVGPCGELGGLVEDALCRKLMELGIDTYRFHPSRTLVVNGLNPEPGVTVSEQLLESAKATLEKGIQVLERAVKPGAIKLVVARSKQITLYGCTTIATSDVYPASIDPLVVYAATGAEHPDNVDVISVSDLYRVGRVAETGLPLLDAVLTVGDRNYRVPTGMPVEELLAAAGVTLEQGATVALDGPMRGRAISDLTMGVPENCTALTIVPRGAFPVVGDSACINCGECVLACPARIQPGMLSRYAEFGDYDTARYKHVEACLECGMCTFVCPANRPVTQYILLAKQQLKAQDEFVASCRLADEDL